MSTENGSTALAALLKKTEEAHGYTDSLGLAMVLAIDAYRRDAGIDVGEGRLHNLSLVKKDGTVVNIPFTLPRP